MRFESIAGTFDLNDDGVMQQSSNAVATKHVGPFGEAAIGGEDHGAFFVAGTDQLKEQIGAFFGQRQVADLIDDEQGRASVEAKLVGELSGTMGQRQGIDQVGQGAAVDAVARFEHRARKPSGSYASRCTIFGACDETRQCVDASRSSDGWNAKSNDSKVFGGISRECPAPL